MHDTGLIFASTNGSHTFQIVHPCQNFTFLPQKQSKSEPMQNFVLNYKCTVNKTASYIKTKTKNNSDDAKFLKISQHHKINKMKCSIKP